MNIFIIQNNLLYLRIILLYGINNNFILAAQSRFIWTLLTSLYEFYPYWPAVVVIDVNKGIKCNS